jgi:hypothetical protein
MVQKINCLCKSYQMNNLEDGRIPKKCKIDKRKIGHGRWP